MTSTLPPCVRSPRWERREAGGDATHPRPGMKGGVGDILPTLPQNPHRPPNPPLATPPPPPPLLPPPPPPPLRRTQPKTAPKKPPQPPHRGRSQRPQRGRRKALHQINEAPFLGLDRRDVLERRGGALELGVRSFNGKLFVFFKVGRGRGRYEEGLNVRRWSVT